MSTLSDGEIGFFEAAPEASLTSPGTGFQRLGLRDGEIGLGRE